jgi:hypothetical protein
VFRAPLQTRLDQVETRRAAAATITGQPSLARAMPLLNACLTDANTIAADAAQATQRYAQRAAKLTQLNQLLANLSATNATIAEPAQKAADDAVVTARCAGQCQSRPDSAAIPICRRSCSRTSRRLM